MAGTGSIWEQLCRCPASARTLAIRRARRFCVGWRACWQDARWPLPPLPPLCLVVQVDGYLIRGVDTCVDPPSAGCINVGWGFMWPTTQESGANIHYFDPLTSEAAVDCKLGCSPLPPMTGVSHEGGVLQLDRTVRLSRPRSHSRWGVHRNGAHNVQRGHGDGKFVRRARPPTQWARNRASCSIDMCSDLPAVRTTTAHCELTPSGPFAIATHGSVFDHAVALGQCIPNDFRFSWLVRRCLPWLETPIIHKMRVSFYSGFDTCFAPSTRNVGCWDANHISNHAFGKWERCYHLWFTDHEHYCVCVCV